MLHLISVIRHRLTDVVVWGEGRVEEEIVTRVVVGSGAKKAIEKMSGLYPSNRFQSSITRLLTDYLDGCIVDLSEVPVDFGIVSPFRSTVLAAARKIPYGTTCSYKELAALAGTPKAVRAVASVMRYNPLPLLIPCHRVVRNDGSPGAYCGDLSGEDAILKKTLLELERNGRDRRPIE